MYELQGKSIVLDCVSALEKRDYSDDNYAIDVYLVGGQVLGFDFKNAISRDSAFEDLVKQIKEDTEF